MTSGEEVPNDILTQILQTSSGCSIQRSPMDINSYLSPVADRNIDMEILVDDFVTFYEAGERVSAVDLSCSCN